jgi:hypothetical protein
MFNWICPKCGQEVLASYEECPNCAKQAAALTSPEQTAAPAPAAPPQAPAHLLQPRSVFPAAPPPPPQYYPPAPARSGLPTWLLSIVFALAFVGLGAGVYWAIQHFKGGSAPVAASAVPLETPPATNAPAKPSPYQKYIEVAGVRLFQNAKKQVEARFLVVNHSDAEMTDVGGSVEIRGRTAKAGEEPVGSFNFKVSSIGPNEAKEAAAPVDTKLKIYELPDWQMVDTRLRLTSPQ